MATDDSSRLVAHDGSYMRQETGQEETYPDQISMGRLELEEARFYEEKVGHDRRRYTLKNGEREIILNEPVDGPAGVRISEGEAVYRGEISYFPEGEQDVVEMLGGEKFGRVF